MDSIQNYIQCKTEDTSLNDLGIQIKREEGTDDKESSAEYEKETAKILKDTNKLLRPSKKISKGMQVDRHNADKFVKFFKKWKELKKVDGEVKQETKFWFSSFNKKLNKTYIYRDFFGSVRIHFRLALNCDAFSFNNLKDAEWAKLFLNLTDFLRNEVFEFENKVDHQKKSQVVPVWIEGLSKFRIEEFPK